MQGVRARYDAELPPIISIVRYPGRPVISVPEGNRPFSESAFSGVLRFRACFGAPFRGEQGAPENATHPKAPIPETVDYLRFRVCCVFGCFLFFFFCYKVRSGRGSGSVISAVARVFGLEPPCWPFSTTLREREHG